MIDYKMIGHAVTYYEAEGFQRIEAPWLVTKEIADITAPTGASSYLVQKDNETKQKVFVASGEQSLLYIINKGFLPGTGRYQTITPCMRNDPFDETHTKYFMKLELMHYSTEQDLSNDRHLARMVDAAMSYFSTHVSDADLQVVVTSAAEGLSYDIMLDGVEIGSYGHRSCLFCNWVYGTGLAEPRFSRLVNNQKMRK
jgi:aspartyl-tRNA synthetase